MEKDKIKEKYKEMNIKTKKNMLTKMLISSSLLLSTTVGLSLALTSCGKKNNLGTPDEVKKTNYLFDLNPKFVDDYGKDANKDNLVLESDVVNLDGGKGYNKDFFLQVDPTFKNSKFFNEKNEDVTKSFGNVFVYYLNFDKVKKEIAFDINEETLSKFSKIEDIKEHISFKLLEKNVVDVDGKPSSKLSLVDDPTNDVKLSFWTKENDNDKEIISDNDVTKIKKVKISLPSSCFPLANPKCMYGILVSFKSIGSDEIKTVVVKFVNDSEFKYFNDKKFYEEFEKDVNMLTNDSSFVEILKVGDKKFNDYMSNVLSESKKDATTSMDGEDDIRCDEIATKNGEKWEFKSEVFFGKDDASNKKDINKLAKYLEKHLSLTLDVEKSKNKDSLCFDPSSLLQKIGDDHCKYRLCVDNDGKYKNNIFLSIGNKSTIDQGEEKTLNLEFDATNIINEKNVAKLTIKQLNKDFFTKDIEVKFKK